jgi:hypothetical protein
LLPRNFLNQQTNKSDSLYTAPQIDLAGNTGVKGKNQISLENNCFEIGNKAEGIHRAKQRIQEYVRDTKIGRTGYRRHRF